MEHDMRNDLDQRPNFHLNAASVPQLLEHAADFVAVLTPEGRLCYLNENGRFLLNIWDADTVADLSLADLATADDLALLQEVAIPTALEAGLWQGDGAFTSQEGMPIPVAQKFISLTDDADQPQLILLARDLTERRWIEDSLRESETRFRSSFENTSMGMALVSTDGRFLQVNNSLIELTGYSQPTFMSLTLDDLIHPHEDPIWFQLLPRIQQGKSKTMKGEVRYVHQDETLRWAYVNASAIQDARGNISYVLFQVQDITKRKEAEEELHRSQAELKAQADSLATINAIADTLYLSLDFATVVEQATDAIVAYTHAPTAAFFTLDTEQQMLQLISSRGLAPEALQRGSLLPLEGTLSGLTVTRKEIVTSHDLAHDPRMQPDVQKELIQQSLAHVISLPLLFQAQVMGVINLLFTQDPAFTRHEFDTLLAIGKTIGLALSNARYLNQLAAEIEERRQLEAAIQSSLAVRSRQFEISRAIATAQTEPEILAVIVNKADLYPHIALSVIMIELEGNQQTDVVRAQNSYQSGIRLMATGTRTPWAESPITQLYSQTHLFVSDDVTTDARISKEMQGMFAISGVLSFALLPLTAGDQWLGNMAIMCRQVAAFDEAILAFYRSVAEQSSIAIRAARLFASIQSSLQSRSREIALSIQIAQQIATAPTLNDLFSYVVNRIKEEYNYYHVQLLRYDPFLDTVALIYGYGEVGARMMEMNHSMPLGVGLIGSAAATAQTVYWGNVAEAPDWQPNPLLPATNSEIAVPIRLQNQVLGVLDIQSQRLNGFDENDRLVLESLCVQIAVAIESTRLREEMDARVRELTTLQRIMSREGWEAYRTQREQQVFGYQFDHQGVLTLAMEKKGEGNGRLPTSPASPATTAIPPTPFPSHDVPLTVLGGEIIGKIGVHQDEHNPLTDDDMEFIRSISAQVAEALEAARLFEQTQDALSEQERLSTQLETVAQVSTAASTMLEVDALLQAVVDLTKASFNLYHVHIYLVDESRNRLVLRAGADQVGRLMTLEGRALNLNAESIVARAARIRRGIVENDVRKIVDFLPNPLLPHTRAELAVPMIVGDQLIGVLDLQSDQIDFFSEEDINIHRTLASQVAVAVQNAILFAEQVETSEKLREVDQLKSEFLASMSHELRTPLNSIIGFADVLLEGLDGDLNERMEEDVRLIRDSGRHLRELIGDILDMSKIEAGRMELRYEEIDVRQLTSDVIATAASLAEAKKLGLYLNVDEDVDTIEADRTRLRQVMWNIIGNAIKFTEKGHISLNVQLQNDKLLVAVEDTGIGIKQENIPIVFEQFRQIDGNLNRSAGGTGLGMPITKKLIELHGGEIWVESVLGQGTTFWFTIPIHQTPRRLTDTASLLR
jgi:PAS domain S-box-containing protein